MHGASWSCKWNITEIHRGYVENKCGIYTKNISLYVNDTLQTVQVIDELFVNTAGSNAYNEALSEAIFNITTLTSLYLSGYAIYGTIPESIGQLIDLKNLKIFTTSISGTLPSSICNLHNLTRFYLYKTNITGSISSCIFCNNHYLESVNIDKTNFIGSIPHTIGVAKNIRRLHLDVNKNMIQTIPNGIANMSMLSHLLLSGYFNGTIPEFLCSLNNIYSIEITDTPYLYGSIPDCLLSVANIKDLYLKSTNIGGTVPITLCNNNLQNIVIINNPKLTGTLPECSVSFNNLFVIAILYNMQLQGTVPSCYLCSASLISIEISHNTNMEAMEVPSCWKNENITHNLMLLNLENNNFIGTFPPLYGYINDLFLGDNNFEGTISDMLPYNLTRDGYPPFHALDLHNNNFVEPDISILLKHLLNQSMLQIISLYDNIGIEGRLPNYNELFINNITSHLLLHGCNIYGSIPSNLQFTSSSFAAITLFDNRLSCKIPDSFISKCEKQNCSSLVISNNLFHCNDDNKFTNWVDPYFSTAINLFVTHSQDRNGWILFVISCLCFIIHLIKKLKSLRTNKFINPQCRFIEEIELFQSKFNDSKLLLLVILLLILYPLSATYFECTPFITWFTMSWFYHQNINSCYYWILAMIAILINIIFCHIVSNLYKMQLKSYFNHNVKQQLLLSEEIDNIDSCSTVTIEYNVKMRRNSLMEFIKFTVLLIVYILGLTLIILYLFCQSLPDNNTLIESSMIRTFITETMALVLLINNSIIVPHLVHSVNVLTNKFIDIDNKTTQIILILRTVNLLFIPIIASLFLLNDCGRWWTMYWTECNDENKSVAFNVKYEIELFFDSTLSEDFKQIQLLNPDQVCNPQRIMDINWSKCTRSFFYNWSYVVMQKFIYLIIMPFFIILFKIGKQKLIQKYNQYKKRLIQNIHQ